MAEDNTGSQFSDDEKESAGSEKPSEADKSAEEHARFWRDSEALGEADVSGSAKLDNKKLNTDQGRVGGAENKSNKPGQQSAEEVEVIPPGQSSKGREKIVARDVEQGSVPGHLERPKNLYGQNRDRSAGLEDESFTSEFWDILEQSGISKKQFFLVLIVFLAFVGIILFFIFGGFGIFSDSGSDKPVVREESSVEEESPPEDFDDLDYSGPITASYILGLEFSGVDLEDDFVPIGYLGSDAGVLTSFIIGLDFETEASEYIYLVNFLSDLQNIYNTDVYELLDNSEDRRKAINQHLKELNRLIIEAQDNLEIINRRLNDFDSDYAVAISDRDFYEQSYFASLDSLDGTDSNEFLQLFIEAGQISLEIRASFNAYNSLVEKYENSLNRLQPRYRDILSNKEAVIEGIKVLDIPNSDIDAIIPVQ